MDCDRLTELCISVVYVVQWGELTPEVSVRFNEKEVKVNGLAKGSPRYRVVTVPGIIETEKRTYKGSGNTSVTLDREGTSRQR